MKQFLIHLLQNLKYCKIRQRSNNIKTGFTLIEAVMAVLVLGISFTVIFAFQSNLLKRVFSTHDFVLRAIYIKNFFVNTDLENTYEKDINKKIDDPALELNYTSKDVNTIKALEKFKNVLIEKSEFSWNSIFGKRKEIFITFKFNPKEQENKSEKK